MVAIFKDGRQLLYILHKMSCKHPTFDDASIAFEHLLFRMIDVILLDLLSEIPILRPCFKMVPSGMTFSVKIHLIILHFMMQVSHLAELFLSIINFILDDFPCDITR